MLLFETPISLFVPQFEVRVGPLGHFGDGLIEIEDFIRGFKGLRRLRAARVVRVQLCELPFEDSIWLFILLFVVIPELLLAAILEVFLIEVIG